MCVSGKHYPLWLPYEFVRLSLMLPGLWLREWSKRGIAPLLLAGKGYSRLGRPILRFLYFLKERPQTNSPQDCRRGVQGIKACHAPKSPRSNTTAAVQHDVCSMVAWGGAHQGHTPLRAVCTFRSTRPPSSTIQWTFGEAHPKKWPKGVLLTVL